MTLSIGTLLLWILLHFGRGGGTILHHSAYGMVLLLHAWLGSMLLERSRILFWSLFACQSMGTVILWWLVVPRGEGIEAMVHSDHVLLTATTTCGLLWSIQAFRDTEKISPERST
jgi:hypothetical protein